MVKSTMGIRMPKNWSRCVAYGVVCASLIYILFGPSSKKKKRVTNGKKKNLRNDGGPVKGLSNPGSACFINATLQAFASLRPLHTWLSNRTAIQQHERLPLLLSIMKLIHYVNGRDEVGSISHNSAADVLSAIRNKRWIITDDEQDVHELFHVLTSAMCEEIDAPPRNDSVGLTPLILDNDKLPSNHNPSIHGRPGVKYFLDQSCHMKRQQNLPFHGYLASQLVCATCNNKKPVQYESFACLSLTLPKLTAARYEISQQPWSGGQPHGSSIESCVERLCGVEILHGVTCESCAKRSHRTASLNVFYKYTWIAKFPTSLVLHIQRTQWLPQTAGPGPQQQQQQCIKRSDIVSYPRHLVLDRFGQRHHSGGIVGISRVKASPLVPQSNGTRNTISDVVGSNNSCSRYRYELEAVICHVGGSDDTGHFITYRRHHIPSCAHGYNGCECDIDTRHTSSNTWYYVSDEEVREVTLDDVLNTQAYMLFYTRVTNT